MDPGASTVTCAGCGTPTPRSEMFGHGADLRCPACAEAIRERLHPSHVRRSPVLNRLHTGQPRATAGLLGLVAVIWIAQQIPPLARVLWPLLEPLWVLAPDGTSAWHIQGFWQPALWAVTHVQIWHLVMNGLSLWQIGRWIDLGWGGPTLAFVVLGSAIFGTTAGWLVNGAPTVGISGGLFALFAWLLALRRHHVVATAFVTRTFLHSIAANCVLLVIISEVGGLGISHVGHAAGFLWGFLAGLAARRAKPLPLFLLLAAATVALLFVAPDL